MTRRIFSLAALALTVVLVAANSSIVVSGQLLAYQDGFVFFTTGDGFRVAPNSSFGMQKRAARPQYSPPRASGHGPPSMRPGR
jgi:hypothetical protein